MRLALVTPGLSGGGAERITALLAQGWAQAGHEVTIISFAPPSADDYPVPSTVRVVALGLTGASASLVHGIGANLGRLRDLRRQLRQLRPDAAIGIMAECSILAIIAGRGLGIPVIACEHNYPPCLPISRHWHWLRGRTYPLAARVLMLTQQGLEWLEQHIPRARGEVMPNPVMFPLPVKGTNLPPEQIVEDGRPVVLTIGRMVYQKQIELAIEAFARIAPRRPDARLVILGEGPDRPQLEDRVRQLGLGGSILMPGWAGNLGDWYRRASVLMLSSRFEGFPNVLLEAMSHGCPPVSVDCPTGPRDIITQGENGWLVPLDDQAASSLAEAVLGILDDPELHARLATASLSIRDQYAIDVVLRHWDQLFARIGISTRQAAKA